MKLLVFWLLLLPLAGQAQMPAYYFDLNEQKLPLPDAKFYVADVLDLRINRHSVGWVQRGLNNIPAVANLRGGAAGCLAQWLHVQLPARPGARPVIMRIHELRIGEQTKVTSEKARALVDVDFVVQQPDSQYYVLLRQTEEEIHGGLETTEFHDDNLAACLRRSLAALQQLAWEPRLTSAAPLTNQQIRYRNNRVPEPYDYPALTAATPKRGVYPNFLAFRRNQPDTVTRFEVEKNPQNGRVSVYTGAGATRVALEPGWGFSDGQQAYVLFYNRYYALHKAGNDFVFEARTGADPGAVGTGAMLAGAAGALVAAAATSGQPQEFVLDMATGRVSDYAYLERLARHDTAAVVVYRRPSGAKTSVKVLLDGREIGTLPAGGLVDIPWASKTREITLCLEDAACLSFIPDFTRTNYVELRAKTDADYPTLAPALQKEGDFYTKKMRRP